MQQIKINEEKKWKKNCLKKKCTFIKITIKVILYAINKCLYENKINWHQMKSKVTNEWTNEAYEDKYLNIFHLTYFDNKTIKL